MRPEREIKFITTPSTSRLTEGKVRYQGQLQHNQVLDVEETRRLFAKYLRDWSGQSGYYLDALGGFIAEQIAQGYRLDFGPFAVGLKMRGSFPAANSPFDAKANAVAVEMMPSKSVKKATATLKPVNVTLEDRCHISGSWQITPFQAADVITTDGTRTFVTSGVQLYVHTGVTDEGIWIEDDLGVKLLEGAITEADCARVCSTFTGHIDPGRYWFVVMSRHTVTGELLRATRRITAE